MRVAVLDLGTNTFNLVIAEENKPEGFSIIYSRKLPVKLGEGGINNGELAPAAYERGINAIMKHYEVIRNLQVDKIKALGTSALRSAKNGQNFIQQTKINTGIDIEIISGELEAEYIYYGVRQTINLGKKYLILDIGGGSNELIIANDIEIIWKKSYDLGIARLLEQFQPGDPITPAEIKEIGQHINENIKDLKEKVDHHRIDTLVGASGSFETFEAMIHLKDCETETGLKPNSVEISLSEFEELYNRLILSSRNERLRMQGLEAMRVEMIVLAGLFVKQLIDLLEIKTLYQSNFSLKEGVIYKLFKGI